ncbi:MAG: hypothetical protein K5839_01690 [Treponemataceae bacterium]|nr:hypothetical protein [Treponemataceae bacterium]
MADKEKNNSGESFFQKFFSRLFKSSDPEAEKKRQLKNIAKDLSKCKYKFLKTNSNEVTGQLAKYFYDIYKAIAPAQAIIRNITNPNALKNAVILFVMEGKQQELYDKLSEEYILAQAEKVPFNELEEEIKRNLATLSSEFDSDKIAKINDIYIKMEAFKTFCNFDYFFLLKKFDSSLRESSFNSVPKFENIRGEYIIEDLKDFLDIVNTMPLEGNWQLVMKIFKEYRGVEPIAGRTWNTILSRLK